MNDLIEKNMGLVLTIVNRFNPKTQTEKDDYIQAGRIGLWKALAKFSKTGGSKFSPYAWNPITWEIIKEIRTIKHSKKTYDRAVKSSNSVITKSDLRGKLDPMPIWEILPSTLTANELQVIKLRLEGYNFKEISSKLNRHRSSIQKVFKTAIAKIRESYNE